MPRGKSPKKTEITDQESPRLYGIVHSNRKPAKLWGKNEFNSTFPAALACYMRDKNIPAVYLTLDEKLKVVASDLPISELFNTSRPNSDLKFDFETRFQPYEQYAHDSDKIGGIDLVIRHEGDDSETSWRRPLEVKLTVMPDNTTGDLTEDQWSPELVIRPASTKYCALGIYHACKERKEEIRSIFESVCGNFQLWESEHELNDKRDQLLSALNIFQSTFRTMQQPFLIQPIWKTKGKLSTLADDAFDLIVWSDFALCRAFIVGLEGKGHISRAARAAARFARVLYVLATQQRANLTQIYTQMAYGHQTDKEFALSGVQTRPYLDTPRRLKPALSKEVVAEIILNGGEKLLSPERRFDATIFFASQALFDVRVAEEQVAAVASEIIQEKDVK
jgi:HindVP restriction endonuclease